MRIQISLLSLLLGTASAVAQSQPALPPIPNQASTTSVVPAPAEVIDFCEFAPVEVGTKCFEVLDGWEQGGVDPTLAARNIKPVDGDTIIASPDWSAALIIRETVRGVRTAAWPNGKSASWLADTFSADLVVATAEGVVIPQPDTSTEPVAEQNIAEVPAPAVTAPVTSPSTTPTAPKLTEGWIIEVENDQGISLATYYDDDATWFQSDASLVMPVTDASDEFTFVRRAKMIIAEDADYTFGITVTAPDINQIRREMSDSNYWDDLINDLNQSAVCSVEFSVNGSPIIKKSAELALVKGSRLDFTGINAGIEKGVYDAKIVADCNWVDDRIQASRRALQRHLEADVTAISFGYDFTATTESGSIRFAVDTDALRNVYMTAKSPAKKIMPAPNLPAGFASGWVLERHPVSKGSHWPSTPGTYQSVARAPVMSVVDYDFAIEDKRESLVVKTLFTPEVSGSYVFAIAPSLKDIRTDANNDNKPLGWRQNVVVRIEDIIFPTQPIRADRSSLPPIESFGHSVGISAVEADLEAGITYNIGFYFPKSRQAACAKPGNCKLLFQERDKQGRPLPGDSLQFLIRTPNDPGLRGFEATEALYKIADTEEEQG